MALRSREVGLLVGKLIMLLSDDEEFRAGYTVGLQSTEEENQKSKALDVEILQILRPVPLPNFDVLWTLGVDKVNAIKQNRASAGTGLKEAKEYVEDLMTRFNIVMTNDLPRCEQIASARHAGKIVVNPAPGKLLSDIDQEIIATLQLGADKYITAIKQYRTLTGAALKEAKDHVDALKAVHTSWGV